VKKTHTRQRERESGRIVSSYKLFMSGNANFLFFRFCIKNVPWKLGVLKNNFFLLVLLKKKNFRAIAKNKNSLLLLLFILMVVLNFVSHIVLIIMNNFRIAFLHALNFDWREKN
jgi:hypothetical protein